MSSGFSYPQPIFESPIYNPSFYLTLDASGYLTYEYAQTLYLDKYDYRLTYITGITPGTATQGIALVPGTNNDVSGIGALSCSSLTVNGQPVVAPPSYVVGITPGTAAINKALVLGPSGEIGTITSLTATNIYGSIKTAAQPSITSLGTLSGLTIDGNLSFTGASRTITGLSTISATTLTGTLSTAAQSNITSIGTLTNLTLSTGGTGLQIPNLKFYNSTTALYDNFNHAYYLNVVEGGAVAQKALVVDINKDIGSIRNLDAVNINGSTKVSGTLGDFGSISIGGTSIITSTRHIQNIGNITISGTMNAVAGYQLNGSTLVDSSQNIYGSSIIADYAQLDKTAGTAYSSTMKSNEYNLVLSQSSNTSGTYSGMAFHVNTSGLDVSTPGACIISERDSATANDGSSISFCTKGSAGSTTSLAKRMTITKSGAINFGSGNSTDGDLLLIKAGGSPLFRFGTALTTKNCISMQWNYAGDALDTNRFSFDVYGTSNALAITAASRVGIGTGTPACGLDVLTYAAISMTGPLATGTTSAYTVNRSGTFTDNVSIYCREALMVGIRGIYTGSDRRVKENISTIPPDDGVKFVRDIDPKIYDLKGFSKRQIGYISQDMMQDYSALISLLPDPNMTVEQEGDVDGAFLSLSYERVPAFLHAALKSVLDRLDNQQRQIDELRAIIAE
jgi:hypothetical protein